MHPHVFEALVDELSNISWLDDLPEWIPCMDCDILRDVPNAADRRKWLRKAKAEIMRREIQERVDEIAEAWENEDESMCDVLIAAFPEDLKLRKNLTLAQRQMWMDKAALAACGRTDGISAREPVVLFLATDDDLVKIGHTTNLGARVRSLRTAHPKELHVLYVAPGSRDDEQALHRRFADFRVGREWFNLADPIRDYIAQMNAAR